MSNTEHRILFSGQLKASVTTAQARLALQQAFKLDEEKIGRFFSGKTVVLKTQLSADKAEQYVNNFARLGLLVEVDPPLPSGASESTPEPAPVQEPRREAPKAVAPKTQAEAQAEPPGVTTNPYAPPAAEPAATPTGLEVRSVFCRECGGSVMEDDPNCPYCGAEQQVGTPRHKYTAAALALFLGFFGAHRFYLGQWWGIVYFVFGILAWPIAMVEGLVFVLTPKHRWNAKYGRVLPFRGAAKIFLIVAAIILLLALVGVIAAISIPAYVDYSNRARILEAEPTINAAKAKVESTTRRLKFVYLPGSNIEAGLPEPMQGPNIEALEVQQGGVIRVTFGSTENTSINGQQLDFEPLIVAEQIQWSCAEGSLPYRLRPRDCRDVEGTDNSRAAAKADNWLRRVSTDSLFALQTPAAWKHMPGLNEESSLSFGNPVDDVYVIVIPEAKQELMGLSFTDFGDVVSRQTLEALQQGRIQKLGSGGIADYFSEQYLLNGEFDEVAISYLLTTVEGKEHYYQILAWGSKDRFAANRETLQRITQSFEETP